MESRVNKSKVFRDTANYKLKGTTFDAKHLDRLISHGVFAKEATRRSFQPKEGHEQRWVS
jgi:hypothetical protein